MIIKKYLLCRPQGGLNDMLCQIETCCRYAEYSGRIVLVETDYNKSSTFKHNFNRYFQSRQRRLVIDSEEISPILIGKSVYPAFLESRLYEYEAIKTAPFQPYIDTQSNAPVTFDFGKAYSQDILVHHQEGGGNLSLFALLRLSARDVLKIALEEALAEIGEPYDAVHIRNTDYRTDYEDLISEIARAEPKNLFVATDSQSALDDVRARMTGCRVFNFSKALSTDGQPLHKAMPASRDEIHSRNIDALRDVMMPAFARRFYFADVSGFNNKKYPSGFSLLAQSLRLNKVVLESLLHPSRLRFGLGLYH